MRKIYDLLIVWAGLGITGGVLAAGDMTRQEPVVVHVELGDQENGLRFIPNALSFETGKLYRLVLRNPSPMKHYFSSEGLSRAVFTRKVQVLGPQGERIAEIKGQIREIEVYPQGVAEWWFVPIQSGTFDDLTCTIPGHAAAGMKGTLTIR